MRANSSLRSSGGPRKSCLSTIPRLPTRKCCAPSSERIEKGVDIKVIGTVGRKSHHLEVRPLAGLRLHTRTIIRDRREAFVGSQSLRVAELDSRREVGVIVRESKAVSGLIEAFESDWARKEVAENAQVTPREIKKKLKAMVKKLSPLNPLVKEAVKEVVSKVGRRG